MKDEAVSPVVAFMLLLMIVVSFISVLNAYYIPSLKQQAEIEHVQNVEESFLKISPDIFNILAFKKSVSLKEPVQLGGGDVILSQVKSSGYLEVNTTYQGDNLLTITSTGTPISVLTSSMNPTRIIYRPSGNFWTEQGYEWEDGIIFVTKSSKRVPLQYLENDDIEISNEKQRFYDMLLPQITLDKEDNKITSVNINLINVISPTKSCSGNGFGTLNFDMSKPIEREYSFSSGDTLIFTITPGLLLSDNITAVINEAFEGVTSGSISWNSITNTMTVNETDGIKIKIKLWDFSIYVT